MLVQKHSEAYLAWVKSADSALERGDYEIAAQHFRRVAGYFCLVGDMGEFKAFARRAGECYLEAARRLWDAENPLKASSLYKTAANCLREAGDEASATTCEIRVRGYYKGLVNRGFADFRGEAQDLKRVGDYFNLEGDHEAAGKCYLEAADRAVNEEKLTLAGGLYRDAGDCYRRSENPREAAEAYEMAADSYLGGRKYFEAAWHYNLAGLLAASMRGFEKAQELAGKANDACWEGRIPVLLNELSRICAQLGKQEIHDAEKRWERIRKKFKESYVSLIDSCFRALR